MAARLTWQRRSDKWQVDRFSLRASLRTCQDGRNRKKKKRKMSTTSKMKQKKKEKKTKITERRFSMEPWGIGRWWTSNGNVHSSLIFRIFYFEIKKKERFGVSLEIFFLGISFLKLIFFPLFNILFTFSTNYLLPGMLSAEYVHFFYCLISRRLLYRLFLMSSFFVIPSNNKSHSQLLMTVFHGKLRPINQLM